MQTRKKQTAIPILILISIAMMGCTMGSGLFTDEELSTMYQVVVSRDGTALAPGARISTTTELGLSVLGIDGAPEADSVELLLSSPDGSLAASILFATAQTEASEAIIVKDFEDDVPPFTMPQDLPDGYYTLLLRIKNADGTVLSSHSTVVLLYEGAIPAPSLAVYPGSVIAGAVSLIKLEADFPAGIDPWIQWTVDGRVLSAGFTSDHADRLPWQAPVTSGVYLAKADIYPFMPPPGFSVEPLTTAEIRLPLSSTLKGTDPLEAHGAWSRLTFDGDLIDKGSRIREEEPFALGSLRLETYASGFGYLLGNGTGISSTSSLLPTSQSDDYLAAFTALFVLAHTSDDAISASGTLLSVPAENGFPGLVIGIEKGFPYFKSGMTSIQSNLKLQTGISRLAFYMAPVEDGVFIQFYLDEQPAGNGSFTSTLFQTTPGTCIISGSGGYSAIFDELRIIEGAYPAFRLSEQAVKGKALISATGFEGGILGPGFTAEGDTIELEHGNLMLGRGSRLIIGPAGIPPQGTSLTFKHDGGKALASIRLADEKSLDIDTDGAIWLDGEATGFKVEVEDSSRLTIDIEPTEPGLLVYSAEDSWVLLDDIAPALDATWSLSSIGDEPAVLSDVSLSILKSTLASSRRLRSISTDSRQIGVYTASSDKAPKLPASTTEGPIPAIINQ